MSAGAVRQGRVFVEIGADPKQFLSAVGQVNRQIGDMGKSMSAMSQQVAGGLRPITAIESSLLDFIESTSQGGRDIVEEMRPVGDASVDASKGMELLAFAAKGATYELEDGSRALNEFEQRLARAIAADGAEGKRLLQTMGIVAAGSSSALADIGSAAEQVRVQMAATGKTAVEVGIKLTAIGTAVVAPISAAVAQFGNLRDVIRDIQTYAGLSANDIGGLIKAAAELGIVLDQRTAVAALQLAASMSKMRLAMTGVAVTIGSIVAPEFTGFAEAVARVAKRASEFIRANRQIITVSLALGSVVLGLGVALTFVGGAMKSFATSTSFLVSPITLLVTQSAALAANVARLGVAFVAANPVAAILTAALVAGGVAAVQAAGGFAGLASILSGAFKSAVDAVAATFPNLTEIVGTTIAGSYNAIAAGDFAGAANILWAGTKAAWTAGTSALMGVLDPWIETAQNAWGDMGTTLAVMWEQMWVTLATSDWGQYLLGAFDNIINSVMGLWDSLVGSIQKGWAYVQGTFKAGFDVDAEIKRIDAENTARAQQRSQDRPGFAGRVGISDEEKARIAAESQARIDAIVAGNQDNRQRRADATRERAQERPKEVAAAIDDLKNAVAAQVAGNPPLAKIAPQALSGPAQTIGTFSAVAAGGLGFGTKGIPEQQLDVLKQIAAGVRGGFGNVGA